MIIIKINKSLCNIIYAFLFLFLLLYFGKITLAIGKNRTKISSVYIDKKIQLKKNTSDTHAINEKNKTNYHHLSLSQSGGGDLSIWSNSFNFAKSENSEVDPRTGMLLVSIKSGLLRSNFGHGPDIDLEMNYNSGAKGNPDHLGRGWAWNLTHYNPVTHQLNTAGGKSFFLEQRPDGSWHPQYHKLKDVIITKDKKGNLVITSANGLQDILDRDGYEIRMEQQNGEGVNFKYMPGSHLLERITDDNGLSIVLTRKNNYLTVTSYDVQGNPVNMRIDLENDEVRNIWFPGNNQQDINHSGLVHLSYETHHNNQDLLTGIHYFTGMEKQFTYDCRHAMKLPDITNDQHPFQPFVSMCVVKQVSVIPGANQPPMNVNYSYTSTNSNNHDYLGFNSGLTELPDLKTDILFEAPTAYTYQTKKDNGQIQIIRTYNKYHLLIDTKTISDKTNKLLNENEVYFCRTDKREGCAHTSFEQLPTTYSLPLKVVTKNWGDNLSVPVETVVNRSYDDYGRLISQTDSYGRKTETKYCPQSGDSQCPAAPVGWPVAALAEETKLFPAPLKNSTLLTPVITTMSYQKEDNRNKPGYTLVLYKTEVKSGDEQRTEISHYYQDKKNPLTYGLLKQKKLTGSDLPAGSVKTVIHHYKYILNKQGTETISDYIDIANKHTVSSVITEKSLFIPKTLRVISEDKKNIQTFEYDKLGRLTAHTDAKDTPFEVTTRNQYQLSAHENSVIVTAPNGMQKKVIFDGTGRKLAKYIEKTDLQGHLQPGLWQQQTTISYNAAGEVAATTHYAQSQGVPVALTTRFDYDAFGRLVRKHLPDGETEVVAYDNAHRCTVRYTEDVQNNRTAVTIGLSSVTGKPTEQIILPATTGTLPSIRVLCTAGDKQSGAKVSRMTYDGFDRLVSTVDPMGKIVQKRYDALGQVTDIINPVGDKIHNVCDLTGHVIQHWVMPAQGGQYLLASAGFNAAGQKLWSAREDGKKTTYHYNINGQLYSINKFNGHHITLSYNNIGLAVKDSMDGKVLLQISYDHLNHQPRTVTDNTGITTYDYRDDGLLNNTIHKGINGYASSAETLIYNSYHHLVSRTDSQHNKIIYMSDKLLRPLTKIYQKNTGNTTQLEQLVYDSFSRVVKKIYGSGMIRLFTYNPWGQVDTIKDSLNGKPLHTESFVYDPDGNIIRLQRGDDQNHQATIDYRYDNMDNLVSMNCEGDNTLCPHDTAIDGGNLKAAPAIIQQDYTFTRLNRIAGVTEKLINTSADQLHSLTKTMSYSYANTKIPLRLTAISTQWNNQQPDTHAFVYDSSGNMIIDGKGNKISYNPFNQITQVINNAGVVSRYDYDGQGKEIKVVTTQGTRQMIYQGGTLSGEVVTDTANNRHRISYLSPEIRTTDNTITDWNESNYKGDVISILKQDKTLKQWTVQQHKVYSPYGMAWSYGKKKTTVPAFQQTLKGFDGEITDAATGWQFLGAGNRTYNPSQRYFVSEDPAGDGYAFGGNNPIMNSDPSGNMPKWLGKMFKLANTAFNLGMNMTHNKFIQGIGRSLMWGGMGLSLGPTFAIGMAFAAPTTLAFASALKPANKGLQQASMITGRVYGGALFVAGLIALGAGIGEFAEGLLATLGNEVAAVGEKAAAAAEEVKVTAGILPTYEEAIADAPPTYQEAVEGNSPVYRSVLYLGVEKQANSGDGALVGGASNHPGLIVQNAEGFDELDPPGGNLDPGNIGNFSEFQRAVLGCGRGPIVPCDHTGVTTVSIFDLLEPDHLISFDAPIEVTVNIIGENIYDEILQEYSPFDYLRVAYAMLKPGGKLYVMTCLYESEWLSSYAEQGAAIFGNNSVDYIHGMESIAAVAERFGSGGPDPFTYENMLVLEK